FTVWGLSDLDSWVPSTFPEYDYAHLFDTKLAPKPDYFAMSTVFAQYNTDGTPINPSMGTAGSSGSGSGTAGGTNASAGAPASAGSSSGSSSGGCSFAPRSSGTAVWLLSAFAMVGILVSRRRSKAAQS
ncbi:MAG TPA: endo-1,4-beta-xylanase, partial [Polyangiaceae bacterium]